MSETYDDPGRLTEIEAVKGSTVLSRFAYGYTKGARDTNLRQRVTDHSGRVTVYSYDPLNRLTRAQDTVGGSDDFQYGYDGNTNIVSRTKNGTQRGYVYNAANQLTSTGSVTYSYDAAGNMTASSAGLDGHYNPKGQTNAFRPAGGFFRNFTTNVLGVGVRDCTAARVPSTLRETSWVASPMV